MTTALILLVVSASLLFLFLYLKFPALSSLPEKEKSRVVPVAREKISVALKRVRAALSLHNILRKLLLFVRRFSFKLEELIIKCIHKVRK